MKRYTKIFITCVALSTITSSLLIGCNSIGNNDENKKTEVEVFLTKAEAIRTFQSFEQQFEKENPDIDIVITSPAQAMTVLKTRLVKDDIPDIITIAGELNYADFVDAEIIEDLSDQTEIIDRIQPAYLDMLSTLEFEPNGNIYAIPYACNAGGVVYNKDIFNELGLEIPTTWNEFISVIEEIKNAGITPFYFTFKDAWTIMPAWNAITANTQPADFFRDRRLDKTTFESEYRPIAEKVLQLSEYGHSDNFGIGYNDGNVAFAQGKAAMMIQGNWAIPEILKMNKEANLGMFILPVNNKEEDNSVISGIDLLFTLPKDSENKENSMKFIEFMTREENMKIYADEQFAIPAIKDMYQEDKSLQDLNPYFKEGKVIDFPDHHYPSSVQVADLVQAYLFDKDIDNLLNSLDDRWNKSQR